MKYCPSCHESLQLDEFPKNKSTKDGHDHYCTLCSRARNRAKYMLPANSEASRIAHALNTKNGIRHANVVQHGETIAEILETTSTEKGLTWDLTPAHY